MLPKRDRIGRFNHDVDASAEYFRLAQEDERISLLLRDAGCHRASIYFVLQAMEKYVRSKVFSIVDPRNEYFRNRHRNHSVEEAVEFLVEVVSGDSVIRDQVKKQLYEHVLGDIRYNRLHNDLRYPVYFERSNSYSCLELGLQDNDQAVMKLKTLKSFIADIDRFRR